MRFLNVVPVLICLLANVGRAKEPLIDVHSLHPGILVDVRYATGDNFTKTVLYPHNRCVLQESVAGRLAQVQQALEKQGLGLKIWDCYRPLSIQKKLWAIVPDDRYVADPKKGSRHNRGAAVDLTLVDRFGQELAMPTAYDDFSEKAHRDYQDLNPEQKKNRALLEKVMTEHGFEGLPTEWWHFDASGWEQYPLLDERLANKFEWPAVSRQALLVLGKDWDSTTGTLERFEKQDGGWKKIGQSHPVALGKKGLGWGDGLHPDNLSGPQKEEGSLKAPTGVYTLGLAYGYAKTPWPGSRWPYQSSQQTLCCVDDPHSRWYNRVVDSAAVTVDWESAEVMKRDDALYQWLLVVNDNFNQIIPGHGSCIFLHLWRASDSPTAGCTALSPEAMGELLEWLDPAKRPLLVQLRQVDYKKYKKPWKLP